MKPKLPVVLCSFDVDERNAMNVLAIASGRCMCISPVKLYFVKYGK